MYTLKINLHPLTYPQIPHHRTPQNRLNHTHQHNVKRSQSTTPRSPPFSILIYKPNNFITHTIPLDFTQHHHFMKK